MKLPLLRSCGDLCGLVEQTGFLPLFRSCVPGFSVEELTPDEYWFKEGVEGPWEWRTMVAACHDIAYAKLFNGKYGFVSMEVYPHLANYRRDGYDFDARVDDGLVRDSDRRLYELIAGGIQLSSDLRKAFSGKGFESALTSLQMGTYVTCAGFDRRLNKRGEPYGWEISRYDISENVFGGYCTSAYDDEPKDSLEKIIDRLCRFMDRESACRLICM